jgi:hypothetical protein
VALPADFRAIAGVFRGGSLGCIQKLDFDAEPDDPSTIVGSTRELRETGLPARFARAQALHPTPDGPDTAEGSFR